MTGAVTPMKALGDISLREPGQSPIEAARQHEAAARTLADEALKLALAELGNAAEGCRDIASFELVPAGARDVLRQLGDQIETSLQTINSISARNA